MDSLPYELLQLVATNLLPRYQCRLALASKYCYRHLYNDLLRWHARKAPISVPKHKCSTVTLIQHNKQLTLYQTFNNALYSNNLTLLRGMCPGHNDRAEIDVVVLAGLLMDAECSNILHGCCKYAHHDCLIVYNYVTNPFISKFIISEDIIIPFTQILDASDIVNFYMAMDVLNIESSIY